MQNFYEEEDFNYFNHFKNEEELSLIREKINQRNIRESVDLFYFISQNDKLICKESYEQDLKEIFEIFRQEGLLEESIYNFLDGWSEYWTTDIEKNRISILGENIYLKFMNQRCVEKTKNMLLMVLPI